MDNKLWKKDVIECITASDTEYVSRTDRTNLIITTQLATSSTECKIYEHPLLGLDILPTWYLEHECILSTMLAWTEDLDADRETDVRGYLLWEVLCFFAPADVLAGLFKSKEMCLYVQKHLKQDGRITINNGSKKRYDKNRDKLKLPIYLTNPIDGNRYQIVFKVVDLSRIGVGGLKSIGESLGVKMVAKSKMDAYKSNMLVAYQDEKMLGDFIDYANEDAKVLFKIREACKVRQDNLYETIGVEKPDEIFYTVGSLVTNLFFDWLKKRIDEAGERPGYECFSTERGKSWTLEQLLSRAGVKHFAKSSSEFTKQANALVQGGRAKNERPGVISDSGVILDADYSSCYATILENLTYPIGLPIVEYYYKTQKKMALGGFLKKYGDELLPRLYTIVVSGQLNHNQTLVPSKVVDVFEINEKYDPDNPKIPADFRLYTEEIINGVITSDVLEILRACCNRNEWASWMKLEVVTASYYAKSLQVANLSEWNKTMADYEAKNKVVVKRTKNGRTSEINNRSRKWAAVPISEFITPFKEKRAELKAKRNACEIGSDEWSQANAEQYGMKLVSNTLYGVIASPYKVISNTIVANNITAAARCACWCLATATGAFQSITDGAAYNANQVRDWSGDKIPSMNSLALWRNPELLERRVTGQLFTKPLASETLWGFRATEKGPKYSVVSNGSGLEFEAKEEEWEYFDEKLLEHIKHFFRSEDGYPSVLDVFKIAHKDVYQSIVIHSQTNYLLRHISGEIKPKARGHKVKGKNYNDETENSNILLLFDDLENNPDRVPPYKKQSYSQILKVNEANRMLNAATDNVVKKNGLVAGDSISKQSWVRPISLSMFHWQSHEQYDAWENRALLLKIQTGYGLEHYFKNDDGTINYQRAVEVIQEKIDKGLRWIVNSDKNCSYDDHPYL